MTLPRYERYKDSGVEWLAQIPSHWTVKRLRFVAELNPSKSEVSHLAPETEVSFLPMETIGEDGSLELDRVRPLADVQTGYTFFRDGDVTIAKITPCFENGKGAAMRDLCNGIGFGTTELIVTRPKETQTTSTYLHWLFTSRPFRKAGEAFMYGAGGQKRVPDDFVRDFAIGFPPLPEQRHIVTFLDLETAKIDALVEEQKRLVELLKEKRQAVISLAVTKGLNPDAPMKDSGVAWLGEVPAHWDVCRLKAVAHVQTGIAKGKDNVGRNVVAVPYLRVANVQDGYLDLDDVSNIEIPEDDLERYRLRAGDVLMNEGGDFDKLGRGHVWDGSIDPCIHQNHVFAVRPFGVSPHWLNMLTSSDYAQFYFMLRSKQSTNLASISSTNLMELPVVVPPPEEQGDLLASISAQAAAIDRLIDDAGAASKLLLERRSALISAAVTGKIDVRNKQPVEV
jgi:type I restriction enzyme S subunit